MKYIPYLLLIGFSANATPITLVLDQRTVSASVLARPATNLTPITASHGVSVPLSSFQPFNASFDYGATVPIDHPLFDEATISAMSVGQSSTLSPYHFHGSGYLNGYAAGEGELTWGIRASASGSSVFSVLFQVNEPTYYHITGDLHSTPDARSDPSLSLRSVGGSLIFENESFGFLTEDGWPGHRPDIHVDEEGILEPGPYWLSAGISVDLAADRFDFVSAHSAYNFTAQFDVPEGGSTFGLLLCGMVAVVTMRRCGQRVPVASHASRGPGR
jgi:hypothetical protein